MSTTAQRNLIESRIRELKTAGILGLGTYSTAGVGAFYDAAAREERAAPFMNFGLWNEVTTTQQAACENLMTTLLAGIDRRSGKILDVGCGFGATTKLLTRYWPSSDVTGINLTSKQIDICRRIAPDCKFLVMDATSLDFENESFDNIICVEAAQHFRTREVFLREAARVLRPGGTLAMSDLLLYKEATAPSGLFPPENYLDSADAYRELLLDAGFTDTRVQDITDTGWRSYARHVVRSANDAWFSGDITFRALQQQLSFVYGGMAIFSNNLLVFAQK